MQLTYTVGDRAGALARLQAVEAIVGAIASTVLEFLAAIAVRVEVPFPGIALTDARALGQ